MFVENRAFVAQKKKNTDKKGNLISHFSWNSAHWQDYFYYITCISYKQSQREKKHRYIYIIFVMWSEIIYLQEVICLKVPNL